jgi:hypothetical protein
MLDPEEAQQPLLTTEPLTQQHSISSQRNTAFSNIVKLRTSTLAN